MHFGHMPSPPPGFSHHFRRNGTMRLHYVEGGAADAPTVVLLAGFPQNWFAWRHVMPLLADRFHVLAIDLPGQGDSDRPLDGYDTKTLASHVHALLESLGIGRYHLAAHDVGAWVAFPYALMFGAEINSLVLMDAGIPGITLSDRLPTAPDIAWKTWHFAFHAVPDLPEILLEGREQAYLEWFLRQKAVNPACYTDEDIAEYLRILRAPGGLRAGLAYYRAAALSTQQNHALTRQARLTMPVLGLSADQGSIPDIAACIRPFGDDVQGERIADCGHFQPEEQPRAVADALLRFFGTAETASGAEARVPCRV